MKLFKHVSGNQFKLIRENEEYPDVISAEDLLRMVKEYHRWGAHDEEYSGDNDILQYPYWKLVELPLRQLKYGGFYNPHAAKEYSELQGELPPVVVSPDFYVLDGFHRCHAAELRQQEKIKAYIPQMS